LHPFGTGYYAVAISALVAYGVVGLVTRVTIGATWTAGALVAVVGSVMYLTFLFIFHRRGWLNLNEFRTLIWAGNDRKATSDA
jgi:hypothetical protein